MKKTTIYILLTASVTSLILGLATLQSKASLEMQWGEHRHIRINPGKEAIVSED